MFNVKLIEDVDCDLFTNSNLCDEIEWGDMTHLGGEIPRLYALQGQVNEDSSYPLYRHPMDKHVDVKPFSPTISRVKETVEKLLGETFNHCVIQCYRNGNDFIGPHADKTLDIVPGSSIVNYSLGSSRIMKFRAKRPIGIDSVPIGSTFIPRYEMYIYELKSNSILILPLETNRYFTHEIRQNPSIKDTRYSFTFRNIGTFYNPKTRQVTGLGAPKQTSMTKKELLYAFRLENKTSASYDELYSKGFAEVFDNSGLADA